MDSITEKDVELALPDESTGSLLRKYVLDYARHCTDAHMSYHLLGGLSLLTQTTPIDLAFPFGTPMHSNIYGLCVGRSSDARKSAAISVARQVLNGALTGSIGEIPGSKESLVDSLRDNPRQLLMYPEFGSFLAQTERSSYLTPLKTAYTEAWDGTPLGRGLVKKKDTEAKFPRLSMLAGSTLEYLERHTELADWTGGFMARFIVMYADRQRTHTVPPGAPANVEVDIAARLQMLNGMGHFGVPRGVCKGFDSAARAIWDQWYFSKDKANRSTEETAGLIARSHAHALRVALLLAWDYGQARSGFDWYVTQRELEPAIRIVELHLRSVMRVGGNLSGSKDMRDRRTVLNTIGNTPISLGEIVGRSRLLLRRVKEIVESLIEEGLIEPRNVVEKGGQHFMRKEAAAALPPPPPGIEFDNVLQFPSGERLSSTVNTSSDGGEAAALRAASAFAISDGGNGSSAFAGGGPDFLSSSMPPDGSSSSASRHGNQTAFNSSISDGLGLYQPSNVALDISRNLNTGSAGRGPGGGSGGSDGGAAVKVDATGVAIFGDD